MQAYSIVAVEKCMTSLWLDMHARLAATWLQAACTGPFTCWTLALSQCRGYVSLMPVFVMTRTHNEAPHPAWTVAFKKNFTALKIHVIVTRALSNHN